MVNISLKQLDDACAAYARSTGSYPNRAGLRAALHTVNLEESLARDNDSRAVDPGRDHHPLCCCTLCRDG